MEEKIREAVGEDITAKEKNDFRQPISLIRVGGISKKDNMKNLKVENVKMIGYITYKQLEKVIIFTKPKGKCVKVEIEIVPITKKRG